mgnify:CR=1 FL=1
MSPQGRKSPSGHQFITHLYRRLLDGKELDLEEETKKLKTIFNREFTKGRLFGEMDKEFMNPPAEDSGDETPETFDELFTESEV